MPKKTKSKTKSPPVLMKVKDLDGDERFKDLHIFRQIRNEFAHSPTFRDFSEQKIQDLMSNINTVFPASTVRKKFDRKFIELIAYIDLQIMAVERKRNNQ